MRLTAALSTLALLAIAIMIADSGQDTDVVELVNLTPDNFERYAPDGKEVDAIAGDVVLRNKYLTAVIAQPLETRNANMTVRNVRGALIDLTTRAAASDQLSAFYPGARKYPFLSWSASVDGTATKLAGTAVNAKKTAQVTVTAPAGENRPEVVVTYQLDPKSPFLLVTSRYTNPAETAVSISLVDDVRMDGGKEEMSKSPNGSSDVFWLHDRFWGQAYGIESLGRELVGNSDARTSTLKYVDDSNNDMVMLEPGRSIEITRRIYPARDLLELKATVASTRGQATEDVQLTLTGANGPVPNAEVSVLKGSDVWGTARTDRDGRLATRLPAGDYGIQVRALGVDVTPQPLMVSVRGEKNSFDLNLPEFKPGHVSARITATDGELIPCKVEFRAKPGTAQPSFGPETGEFGVRNLQYVPLGRFEQDLPPGEYDVIISHGPEFDAVFTTLTVPPGKTVPLTAQLAQTVATPGWISSDFHSHSSPSGDNTGSQLGRVLNLVTEHIEFAPCTEHNRISTYEPHITSLGIGKFIGTVSGMELTGSALPVNHQNAFPMVLKPYTQDGGAPVTDNDPATQIERLALWDHRSDKLVQVNHPDMGWMFFDADGDGETDAGLQRMFAQIEVLEVHPVEDFLKLEKISTRPNGRTFNHRALNWLQLLNQGFRYPGVVNTDSHYNFHGSGWLRNWLQSPTDDPAAINPLDVVHAAEQGRVIMSNGPYLEVRLNEVGGREQVTAGQSLTAKSRKVEVHVRVQCPNWFDVNVVDIRVNGRVRTGERFTRKTHPDLFKSDGALKFDQTIPLTLTEDAHIIVVTGGDGLKLGPVVGPDHENTPPAAVANPIYIDVDGEGFVANKDRLDFPLPVKH